MVEAVTVSPGLDPRMGAEVVRMPYSVAGEPTHNTVSQLRWLNPTRLVFVGVRRTYRQPCMCLRPSWTRS